jgi:hypothetical protein
VTRVFKNMWGEKEGLLSASVGIPKRTVYAKKRTSKVGK